MVQLSLIVAPVNFRPPSRRFRWGTWLVFDGLDDLHGMTVPFANAHKGEFLSAGT